MLVHKTGALTPLTVVMSFPSYEVNELIKFDTGAVFRLTNLARILGALTW